MSTAPFAPGNYRYIPGVFQYSGGVAPDAGYRLERVMFRNPVPLKDGFARVEALLKAAGRPLTAFAACELRSPEPFTEEGFRAFNEIYVGTLAKWASSTPPRAPTRSPAPTSVPRSKSPASLVPRLRLHRARRQRAALLPRRRERRGAEGKGNYKDHITRRGDISAAGLTAKARYVLGEMERRMGMLGYKWADATAAQLYTVHDPHPFLASEIVRRGAARCGLTWHFARPPVVELEYEMDCRGISVERVE